MRSTLAPGALAGPLLASVLLAAAAEAEPLVSASSLAASGAAPISTQPTAPAASQPAPPARTAGLPDAASAGILPEELVLSANHQEYDAQTQRFVASGNVMLYLAGGRLLADRLEFDTGSRTLLATGRLRFQRGQQYLQASRLRYSLSEGVGTIEDVYGVIDLDGSDTDFNLEAPPSAPLTAAQPPSCTPLLPPIPSWHPFAWAATAWGGQMVDNTSGSALGLSGRGRPEVLGGIGLQRRLLDGGPLSLELDTNLLGHVAQSQAGGPYNQAVAYANTPAQSFGELTGGLGVRLWLQPWLNIFAVEGVSVLSSTSHYERTFREASSSVLNYTALEVEALVSPQWSLVGRVHQRSGAFGAFNGVREGSTAYLVGLRHRFGEPRPLRPRLQVAPAPGCPGAPAPGSEARNTLASALETTAMEQGTGRSQASLSPSAATTTPRSSESLWQRARRMERERAEAVDRLDQRVSDVRFQQSLISEQKLGFTQLGINPETVNGFGQALPQQLQGAAQTQPQAQSKTSAGISAQSLVTGTISRWRFQARRMEITPTALKADRVALTNDPFTPAQSWLDADGVTVVQISKDKTRIWARRNQLVLDERLPIPMISRTTIEQQVSTPWLAGIDDRDRNGAYIGYQLAPLRFGASGSLALQPQLLIQRALNGSTNSYPLPGQPADAPTVSQPTTTADLFGLIATLKTPLAGFQFNGTADLSTLNPEHLAAGTRSWAELSRSVKLPLLGESTLRIFGAYRYRTWNGTLGEQDVYAAYGVSLEDTGNLPNWGALSSRYYWKVGSGNYQATAYSATNAPADVASTWRTNVIGSLNASLPLWTGKTLPLTRDQAYRYSAVPIKPGLSLAANITGSLAVYGNNGYQNTLSISGGPTLTLGHFQKPFFDYTQFSITGGGTFRQGLSPLGFDRAVDLGTLNFGLTQQIAGPLVFSGGVGINIDPNSSTYGGITNSYLELRWQQRAYEVGVFYSPYAQLGGLRIKLNDFNFQGPGLPFTPYEPTALTSPARRLL
ncbi:MAG: hypothetical protein RLZZ624_894 [Cyanobacteriota bacterium]